jgi:hypothetical protein
VLFAYQPIAPTATAMMATSATRKRTSRQVKRRDVTFSTLSNTSPSPRPHRKSSSSALPTEPPDSSRVGRSKCAVFVRRVVDSTSPDWPASAAEAARLFPSSSITSMMTQVMLSRPPWSLARRTSSAAASSGLTSRRSVAEMRSSSTSLNRPSEQSRYRSPVYGSTVSLSTSTSRSMPSARVRMLRCGWTAASSSLSWPSRRRSSTRLWSRESWSRSPSRKR